VHTGYRCGLSTRATLASAAGWHNESLNIWSHAVGALAALLALFCAPWAPPGAPAVHTALAALAMLPVVVSFSLSVVYHTGMAHAACSTARGAAARYDRLLCADVAGVVGVLALPQGAILFYGFHTAPVLRCALAAAMALAALLGARATTAADQTARAAPLACVVAGRLLALALRCGGVGAACAPALRCYVAMETAIALGGAANAAFFPERHFPGRFDFFLNRCVDASASQVYRKCFAHLRAPACHATWQPPVDALQHGVCGGRVVLGLAGGLPVLC
jgi:adiponectin receptor